VLDRIATDARHDGDPATRFAEHVDRARREFVRRDDLGAFPEGLMEFLAEVALAGPGVCALRALGRVTTADVGERVPSAVQIAEAARSLFNRREVTAMLRGTKDEASYAMTALRHCAQGNLQAVLDEYVHVLVESEGLQLAENHARLQELTTALVEAVTMRTATSVASSYQRRDDSVVRVPVPMRTHIAALYGREDASSAEHTEARLKRSFNSPFWPFVLATTSVGQEGLDFHAYCHAVVHWNLPSNPVDLEQREGRVHRYKGHVIRKNLAGDHAEAAFAGAGDPWQSMFDAAHQARDEAASDLVPYWVYPGEWAIERYVPAFALSRESARYSRLKRGVGAYRLLLGMSRQSDLVGLVGDGDVEWMRLDFTPGA